MELETAMIYMYFTSGCKTYCTCESPSDDSKLTSSQLYLPWTVSGLHTVWLANSTWWYYGLIFNLITSPQLFINQRET